MHEAHLAHALSQADGHQALLAAWRAADPPGRAELLPRLDRLLGVRRRQTLEYEWSFGHGRAVLLWHVPAFAGKSFARVTAMLEARLAADRRGPLTAQAWVEVTHRPKQLEARVVRMARERLGIHAVIHVVKTVSVRQEDDRHAIQQTVPVEVMIPLKRPAIVRSFATVTVSRAALRTFLTWLSSTPPEGASPSGDHFRPVTFSEDTAAYLERKLELKKAGVRGDDPRGINGKYEINGREAGEHLLPLDLSAPEVAMHVSAPRDERTYNYVFAHPDGFREQGRVKFKIRHRPTHLEFPVRTSRSAMEWLVNELLDAVDAGQSVLSRSGSSSPPPPEG